MKLGIIEIPQRGQLNIMLTAENQADRAKIEALRQKLVPVDHESRQLDMSGLNDDSIVIPLDNLVKANVESFTGIVSDLARDLRR